MLSLINPILAMIGCSKSKISAILANLENFPYILTNEVAISSRLQSATWQKKHYNFPPKIKEGSFF